MASNRNDIVSRGSAFDDSGLKNAWRWDWCDRDFDARRVGEQGKGYASLVQHLGMDIHKDALKSHLENATIPAHSFKPNLTYGLHPSFIQTEMQTEAQNAPLVPMADRIRNMEATILSFVGEHSLPLNLVPSIIDLAKTLSVDQVALQKLTMDRTSASYKFTYGVAKTFDEDLVEELKSNTFELNLDEATNSNQERTVTVLAQHYSSKHSKVLLSHLKSFTMTKITSEGLYDQIANIFEDNQLPWKNLTSMMMDSCNIMRGSKGGLETLIRERKAPHLLDIDEDTCHHAHNAAKAFCAPFNNHVESLFLQLHTDFKWSGEQKDILLDICRVLGIAPSPPQRFIPHRWLSVLTVSTDTLRLFDAFIVYFHSLLSAADRIVYKDFLEHIYQRRNVNDEQQQALNVLQGRIRKGWRNFTTDGKERKQKITEKLFTHNRKTKMILHLYCAVLPTLNRYVTFFQTKEPVIHELHCKHEEILREFLGFFLKPSAVRDGPKRLKALDLDDDNIKVKDRLLFLGVRTWDLLKEQGQKDSISQGFISSAKAAFLACGKKLLSTMPLGSKTLRIFSFLDPRIKDADQTPAMLIQLPELFPQIQCDMDEFSKEVRNYCSSNLPPCSTPIDVWWRNVDKTAKFPILLQYVKAAICNFHGPLVEGSFSLMGNVIRNKTTNICPETFSSYQTIKYKLMGEGASSVFYFKKKDPKADAPDKSLMINLANAWKGQKKRQEDERTRTCLKLQDLGTQADQIPTKRKDAMTTSALCIPAKIPKVNPSIT